MMTSCMSWRCACTVFLIALCASVAAPAAAQSVGGTLLGTVVDNSGAVLPGASVTATNTATAVARATISDGQGRYSIADLSPGPYDVGASLSGFQTVLRRGIRLVVGNPSVVDFTLGISGVAETVTVSGAAPIVDTVSTALGTVVEQKQMAELPLADRSYSRLIVLAPGANEVPPATAGGQFQQFFGRQPQYTVSGARPEGQVFLLDNTNVQNYWNRGSGSGQLGTTLGVEAIAEYQVLTNTYSAQFGGNGVAINAITKSGANQFHGSLFEYFRDNALDASNYFDQLLGRPDPTLRKNQFGGSHGGPLVANKAFYFVNYEGLRQTQGTTQVITVPDANARGGVVNGVRVGVNAAIAPVLALYPAATRQTAAQAAQGVGQTDVINNVAGHENYFVGRVDYTATNRTSLFVRYTDDTASVAEPNSGSPIPLWASSDDTGNHYFTAELKNMVRPALLNAVRFGFTRTEEAATRTDLDNGLLTFFPGRQDGTVAAGSGIVGLGGNQVLPFTQRQTRFMIADDLGWTRAGHALKFGLEYERQTTFVNVPLFGDGAWTFPSLTAFLQNQPSLFLGALPGQTDAARNIGEWRLTSYAQDEWRISPRVTINLGLRYDPRGIASLDKGQTLANGAQSTGFTSVTQAFLSNPTLANWEPRVGVAFDPSRSHKTAVRAGYGVFHSTITANRIGPAYGVNPPFALGAQVRIPIPGIPVPVFPTPNPSASQISQMQGLDYDITGTPRLAAVERERAARDPVQYQRHAGVRRQSQRSSPAAARRQSGAAAHAGGWHRHLRLARRHANGVQSATQPGVRRVDHRQHVEHVELSLTAGGAQPSFREGHSVAGVVHAVALPRHVVRQLAVRGRDSSDQSLRPQLRRRSLPDRPHA